MAEAEYDKEERGKEAYYTLSGDVNNDMVSRVFDGTARMSEDGITTAHILFHSHGGYVSDGICLYNYLSNLPVNIVMYNCGVVASIGVIVFLSGHRRVAADTARFMIHKSHATPPSGVRSDALKIIADGLIADDARTESILNKHLTLTPAQWKVHDHSDLHIAAIDACAAGMVESLGDFKPPRGARIIAL
ncbi:MAG TPA: ATP-dependent Clp protease proteolytic subunit [Burkholderiaceae bacterium]